jgi:hypothetical protein
MASKIEATDEVTKQFTPSTTHSTPENGPLNLQSLTSVLNSGDMATPHVLISLALEEEQLLNFEQCRRWLQAFPAMAKYAKVQGVYRSNSTLLVLSLPVAVWDWLPSDPACTFIGYVHSENLYSSESDSNRKSSRPKKEVIIDISQGKKSVCYLLCHIRPAPVSLPRGQGAANVLANDTFSSNHIPRTILLHIAARLRLPRPLPDSKIWNFPHFPWKPVLLK